MDWVPTVAYLTLCAWGIWQGCDAAGAR